MMDFGNDSALAARYKAEHGYADEAVGHGVRTIKERIQSLKNRKVILKMDMCKLIDMGYTPSLLVAAGIPWKDMQLWEA